MGGGGVRRRPEVRKEEGKIDEKMGSVWRRQSERRQNGRNNISCGGERPKSSSLPGVGGWGWGGVLQRRQLMAAAL